MKSEWKVSSNLIGDKKMYIAFRIRNTSEVDHSGNREYSGNYTEDRQEAAAIADRLNAEAGDKKCQK